MAEKLVIAKTVQEACEAKNSASAFLAGGTETERLGSAVNAETLILLKHVPGLDGIEDTDAFLRIGALCTFQRALEDSRVPDYLKTAFKFMASRTKRNMATVGGNIAALRCDSYLIPTLIAAGAKVEILDASGEKSIAALDYYAENRKRYADALITALLLSHDPVTVLSRRYANTAESHACLTISAGKNRNGFAVSAAIKNAGVFSLRELAEKMETGEALPEEEILGWCRSWTGAKISDDMFGSEAYKRYLLGVTIAQMAESLRGENK